MQYDFDKALVPQVRRDLVDKVAEWMCFRLESERLDRISDRMGAFMRAGLSFGTAFFEALEEEELLHGTARRDYYVPLTWAPQI